MSEKVFKTIDEQIEILKSRNLKFIDEENAARILQKISYYDIINGYNDIFLETKSNSSMGIEEKYFSNATFELIYDLYRFDANLRSLFLKYMDIIENYLSSSLAYVISSNHGHKEADYIEKTIYKKGKKITNKKYEVDGLIERLQSCTNKDMTPIVYYKNQHGYLPPWILFKYLMLGEKERLFQLLLTTDRDDVVKIFQSNFILSKNFSATFYTQGIAMIREFRNTCAHGSRLYNHTHKFEKLPYNHVLEFLNVNKTENCGKNDLTALIISLYAFLGGDRTIDSHWVSFINEFSGILSDFKEDFPEYFFKELIKEMNLPQNFKKLCYI